jgi:acyl carrier protein
VSTDIDLAALERSLIDWVRDWTESDADTVIGPETDLAGTALLDSMGLVALISYLEDETGRTFDFATLAYGSAMSVRGLIRHCLA